MWAPFRYRICLPSKSNNRATVIELSAEATMATTFVLTGNKFLGKVTAKMMSKVNMATSLETANAPSVRGSTRDIAITSSQAW